MQEKLSHALPYMFFVNLTLQVNWKLYLHEIFYKFSMLIRCLRGYNYASFYLLFKFRKFCEQSQS